MLACPQAGWVCAPPPERAPERAGRRTCHVTEWAKSPHDPRSLGEPGSWG